MFDGFPWSTKCFFVRFAVYLMIFTALLLLLVKTIKCWCIFTPANLLYSSSEQGNIATGFIKKKAELYMRLVNH